MLSDLAITDPKAFSELAEVEKSIIKVPKTLKIKRLSKILNKELSKNRGDNFIVVSFLYYRKVHRTSYNIKIQFAKA